MTRSNQISAYMYKSTLNTDYLYYSTMVVKIALKAELNWLRAAQNITSIATDTNIIYD
jgi:hypothetical protein